MYLLLIILFTIKLYVHIDIFKIKKSALKNKVACLRPVIIKKETLAQVFSCEFCEIFKNTFLTEHFRVTDP